ncbi:MAG: DUF5698 domain-containing protein [Thermodesulfobacteriota bacterium]
MDLFSLLLGIGIFFSRVADVTLGTMRTLAIVQGRTKVSFVLGFFEVSLWLVVISTVVHKIVEKPFLGVFYALGYATGNVVGIRLERKIGQGYTVVRVITVSSGEKMAARLRDMGFGVTTFEGQGRSGPVTELYVVCRRKDLTRILCTVQEIDLHAFYITEHAGSVSKILRPMGSVEPTGWRAILKKK